MADPYTVAKEMYPILKGYDDYKIVNTPDENSPFVLEHFPPGERGSLAMPRPEGININEYGLQIFKDVRPEDIAGDIISHHLVNEDKYLSEEYQKFKNSIPIETMKNRYEYDKNNFGEERDFNSWLERTGYPELFRGYVFNQFDKEEINRIYNSEQKKILENIKNYITKKGMNTGGDVNAQTDAMLANKNQEDLSLRQKFSSLTKIDPNITFGEKLGNIREQISSWTKRNPDFNKDEATKSIASLTPIVGDAMAAKEIYDELQKDNPNYLLVGALGGAAIIGLIPGIGDAAAAAIRTGARRALDVGKRIEIDPDAVGTMGGNIRLAPKKTLDDFGYYIDNPATKGYKGGEDWVKNKQRYAEEAAARGGTGATKKFFNGPTTANLGGVDDDKPLFLDSKFLASIKGANDEVPNVSDPKYQELLKDVQDNGFDPNQKGNKVVVGVNHKGEAYLIEGNTRAAVASKLGIPSVKVEVRYWNGAETVDGPYSPQNILKYASKEPKKFAKGGTTMNNQMQMAFMNEGGLTDDGMTKDPVSGNEVPPGSLAKEVRDDIPAQLSEGEYVVPADVARYYGINFFENLRNQAKQGLNVMEQTGRIGGEPVPPSKPIMQAASGGMAQDLSNEELQAIKEVMGFRENFNTGTANAQKTTDQTFHSAAQTALDAQPTFKDTWSLGSTIFKPTAGAMTSWKVTLYSPEGKGVELTLPQEQPKYNELISKGYTTVKPIETVKPKPKEKEPKDPTDPFAGIDPNRWMNSFDYKNATVDTIFNNAQNLLKEKTGLGKVVSNIFGGGFLGLVNKMSNVAKARAQVILLEASGHAEKANLLKTSINGYIKENGLTIIDKNFNFAIDGKQFYEGIKKQNPNLVTRLSSSSTPTPPVEEDGGGNGGSRDSNFSADPIEKVDANITPTSGLDKGITQTGEESEGNIGGTQNLLEVEKPTDSSATVDPGLVEKEIVDIGGANKGGLMMSKPKKKRSPRRKTGLAGKK